ncbi:hypothetical protein WG66_008844, partial [Moniliophthora roreri]
SGDHSNERRAITNISQKYQEVTDTRKADLASSATPTTHSFCPLCYPPNATPSFAKESNGTVASARVTLSGNRRKFFGFGSTVNKVAELHLASMQSSTSSASLEISLFSFLGSGSCSALDNLHTRFLRETYCRPSGEPSSAGGNGNANGLANYSYPVIDSLCNYNFPNQAGTKPNATHIVPVPPRPSAKSSSDQPTSSPPREPGKHILRLFFPRFIHLHSIPTTSLVLLPPPFLAPSQEEAAQTPFVYGTLWCPGDGAVLKDGAREREQRKVFHDRSYSRVGSRAPNSDAPVEDERFMDMDSSEVTGEGKERVYQRTLISSRTEPPLFAVPRLSCSADVVLGLMIRPRASGSTCR